MDSFLKKLSRHEPTLIGLDTCMRSAVCIPLLERGSGYELLFEVRAAQMESQPGDVCFPGGRLERDETPAEAALREMTEELLIKREQLQLIGAMDVLYTGSLIIYPYAVLLRDYGGTFSPSEVGEVFTVPLEYFLEHEPMVFHTEAQVMPEEGFPYELIHGGRSYRWRRRTDTVYFYQYGSHVIWGLTAKLVHSFAGIARET